MMPSKISYSKHALFIVLAYILGLSFSNLINYLYTRSEETVFFVIGSIAISIPFLLASLLLLPFVRGSLEEHTLRWCVTVTFLMTAIFLCVGIFGGMELVSFQIPIFVFSSTCMASAFYYFCVSEQLNFVSEQLNKRQLNSKNRTSLLLAFLAFCALSSFAGYYKLENLARLQHTPREFGVSKIIYSKEESWGFGPGGNETGVIVYELPEDASQKILDGKISYLGNLPSKGYGGKNWQGRYPQWFETPLNSNGDWIGASSGQHLMSGNMPDKPHISDYLNKYGFGIQLDNDIERMIDAAISKPGNFYAYGRIGLIIIIPDSKKVVYAYNG